MNMLIQVHICFTFGWILKIGNHVFHTCTLTWLCYTLCDYNFSDIYCMLENEINVWQSARLLSRLYVYIYSYLGQQPWQRNQLLYFLPFCRVFSFLCRSTPKVVTYIYLCICCSYLFKIHSPIALYHHVSCLLVRFRIHKQYKLSKEMFLGIYDVIFRKCPSVISMLIGKFIQTHTSARTKINTPYFYGTIFPVPLSGR